MQRERGLKDCDDYDTHRGYEHDGHYSAAFDDCRADHDHPDEHTPHRHAIA